MSKKNKEAAESTSRGFGFLSAGFQVLCKVVCLFDDIPFLIQSLLRNSSIGIIGTYLLIAAGFILFSIQLGKGIYELYQALKMEEGELRDGLILASLEKIMWATIGFLFTTALLIFTFALAPLWAGISSIGIPGTMAIIEFIELVSEIHEYQHAETEKEKEMAKCKIFFSAVFFSLSVLITAFAALSVLSGLGIVSLGIVPACVLVGIVGIALVLKIFELVDERCYDHQMSLKIRDWFSNCCQRENTNVIRIENTLKENPVIEVKKKEKQQIDQPKVIEKDRVENLRKRNVSSSQEKIYGNQDNVTQFKHKHKPQPVARISATSAYSAQFKISK